MLPKPALVEQQGVSYFLKINQNRGQFQSMTIGIPFGHQIAFTMAKEQKWDIFFKNIGFSIEFQTGDPVFDQKIYIAAEHPLFCRSLANQAKIRELILELFDAGFDKLWSDGRFLYLQSKQNLSSGPWISKAGSLVNLFHQFFKTNFISFGRDPFAYRAIIVESIVWGIASYSVVSYFESYVYREDFHLNHTALLKYGLSFSIGVLVLLMFFIILFLKRTSRSHIILVECLVLLVFSLPIAGMQLASDVNRGFDRSESEISEVKIINLTRKQHRRRRSSYYTYHMKVNKVSGPVEFPEDIKVSLDIYQQLREETQIKIETGKGYLNVPWYRKIADIDCSEY